MDFLQNGAYDSFTELMHYFYFEYAIYCILLLIMLLISLKVFSNYLTVRKNPDSATTVHPLDIAFSILIGIAFLCAMMFQGVISDISAEQSGIWFSKVLTLFVIYIVFFILQFIFINRIFKYTSKD